MSSDQSQTPYSTTVATLQDLASYIEKELGLSAWVTIDQDRINAFAQITEDHQWIHTEPEKAAQLSPFGGTIAHGFLVLSLASKFVYETYQIGSVKMGLNYGLDRVRFIHPVRVDAQVRGRAKLVDMEMIPNGAKLKVELTFEIKGEEKPACVAEFIGMVFE